MRNETFNQVIRRPLAVALGFRPPFKIKKSVAGVGYFKELQIDSSGVARVIASNKGTLPLEQLQLHTNLGPAIFEYWYWKPGTEFSEFTVEFKLPAGEISHLELSYSQTVLLKKRTRLTLHRPHYASLRDNEEPLDRNRIYSYGPPSDAIAPEILEYLSCFQSPHLDFGCGKGALVRELKKRNLEVTGIEINRPEIAKAISEDVKDNIILYKGDLPLPFKDEQFETTSAIEVIEHISTYKEIIAELARVTKNRVVITVPDISAIPLLFKHSVVPWHLLESTHYNFFTQTSLEKVLKPYFSRIEFSRTCPNEINTTTYWTSLVAICHKK